jgi:hypothetical protein
MLSGWSPTFPEPVVVSVLVSEIDDASEAEGRGFFRPPNVITVFPYQACVHVGTGEASLVNMGVQPSSMTWQPIGDGLEAHCDAEGAYTETRIALTDEERRLKNLDANNKRARAKFRRYAKRNRLRKMWVLTFTEATWDRALISGLVNELMVKWRSFYGGHAFPYAYVLELHPSGHGYHVHVATPLGFMDKNALQKMWGHGVVWFSDRKAPKGTSARKQSEILSYYLAKYLDKSFDDESRRPGEHRYEVAQGFDPVQVRRSFATAGEAREWLMLFEGEQFREVWCSDDQDEWDGRPVWLFSSA